MIEFLVEGFVEGVVEIALELILGGELGPSGNWCSREVITIFGEGCGSTTATMK
jgi:hypothetical protein